jgi:hypothetical protein
MDLEKRRASQREWARKNRATVNIANQLWREKNKERAREYARKYRADGRRKKVVRTPATAAKIAARKAVARAISNGHLLKDKCEVCESSVVEAHHYKGYSREHWLTVQWLCKKCHAKQHREY